MKEHRRESEGGCVVRGKHEDAASAKRAGSAPHRLDWLAWKTEEGQFAIVQATTL